VIGLQEGDTLCFAAQCNDQNVIMVACSEGKVASYLAQEIPERAGRSAQGVRAKKLKKGGSHSLPESPNNAFVFSGGYIMVSAQQITLRTHSM
jgi:DNA gyrase/topoisomerase IV subunit A